MNRRRTFLAAALTLAAGMANAQQEGWHDYNVAYWQGQDAPHAAYQAQLRDTDAWQAFQAEHGNWYVHFNEFTGLPHRATGKAFAVDGADAEQRARHFLATELAGFDLPLEDLRLTRVYDDGRFTYVDFEQVHEGLRVLDSRVSVRLTADGRVVMFGVDAYPGLAVNTAASLSPSAVMAAAAEGLPTGLSHLDLDPERYVLPVPGEDGLRYRLVHRAHAEFEPLNGVPGQFAVLVDAETGELLSRKNTVFSCAHPMAADVTVEGGVVDNPSLSPVTRGLPYARVRVAGTDYFADVNGVVNIPSVTAATSATVYLDGRYAEVVIGASGINPSSFTTTLVPGPNTVSFDADANEREISAYYHTNVIHDFMKAEFPGFTDLDYPFLVRVDRTDGTCNAFYNGSSINFYANGGGCPATALFSDVVYHEYGHALNNDVYDYFGDAFGFPGMDNGGLNEGYADVWGLSISFDPILGSGFSGGSSFVRRYDVDPKRYPEDLVGQVHADGEIIAGAWWDYGQERGDPQEMVNLFLKAYPATHDGPDGTEGTVYRDILLEALIQDDDDADLGTGTPNDEAIITAFGIHGITLLANVSVDHAETTPLAATPVPIEAELDVDFGSYLGDFNVVWRPQGVGSWTTVPMVNTSGDAYRVDLPAQPEGTILEYYFEVFDIYGTLATVQPADAQPSADPNLPYYSLVGYVQQEIEDFDNFFGDWIPNPFGTDDATTGNWEINSPQASFSSGFQNQPGTDHTPGPGNLCAVTGATGYDGSGPNFDVDNGETTLRSPAFDAAQYDNPVFAYWRWFSNDPPGSANPGNDPWEVSISNDGTTWVPIRETYTSDASWRRDVIRISDFVAPTSTVYLLFTASDRFVPGTDLDGGSLMEAALDDLALYGVGVEDTTTTPSGLDVTDAMGLSVFPNPAAGAFTVRWDAAWQPRTVQLHDAAGREVYATTVARGGNALRVPDLQLADGLYTLRLRSADGRTAQRTVAVQR